ncbi:hypothetical protein J1N35_012214 [Gossypium stocksii]|uniref:Uncharacterized protein n=1 Tax=Gossypium stocksii TaxID=47602 RepID=A0A9D3W3U9_9ROSI|nr:hypothetical protein J1N35_012214 [Gossypium stocksii]
MPTVEEYTTLLRYPKIQADKAYSRAACVPTFWKKLMNITGMSEQWIAARIKQKGEWYVDEAVSDLFVRLEKRVTPIPTILVFSENYSSLKEIAATPRRDDISEENSMAILQNLKEEDVEWRAPWMVPNEILYRCGSFD